MNQELSSVYIIKVLKRRIILFASILITGIIISALFFVFKYPPKYASVMIYSEDFGDVFKMVNDKSEFLSNNEFNRLIDPVIKGNRKQNKKYKIQIKDTLVKEKVNNSILRILDLIVTRKFPKNEENLKGKFVADLEDFFTNLEKKLFSWFLYKQKITKINIENRIYSLEESIEISNKEIEVVKKLLEIDVGKYQDMLVKNSYFLPPSQQYYGLIIEKNNNTIKLELLKANLNEVINTIKLIEDEKIESFSGLSLKDDLKKYTMTYNSVTGISNKFRLLKKNYCNKSFSTDPSIAATYLMICSFIFVIFFSFIVIFLVEWWRNNKKEILR